MALTRSFVRNAATTPLDARLMDMAGIAQNVDGSPRSGVLGGANTTIVTTTGTMVLSVAAAEFATSKGKADGVAIFTNDGTVNVAIAPAPASNSRIDVLWVKHNDDTTGDANALPVFGVTAGTAAASPTKPAIPTGALELATLRIYAGTTSTGGGSNTLTNTYRMTAARGGVVPFRTWLDLDAWTTPAIGQLAVALDDGGMYVRASSGWIPTAFAAGILMRRSTTAGSVSSSTYTDLSASSFWTERNRSGFPPYAAGITAPFTGVYRLSYSITTTAVAIVAGVTVNKSASVSLADLECPAGSGLAQGVAVASTSGELLLNAGDVVRLYAIAASSSAPWRTEAALSLFQLEYVRAA